MPSSYVSSYFQSQTGAETVFLALLSTENAGKQLSDNTCYRVQKRLINMELQFGMFFQIGNQITSYR